MCGVERERERGNRIKQQQKPSQQQKEAKKEAEGGRGGTAGGGLGLKRGGEGKRTRRRWGAEEEEEEEEEWGQNWFAFFSLPLSPNRTQSLRDPEGRGGTKRKREREANSQGRTEGRKEGRKRGQCWLCVARWCLFPPSSPQQAPFPSLLPLRPQIEASTPLSPPFLPQALPSFHFSSSHLVCNIRGLLRRRPKKGGRRKRKRKFFGEIFGGWGGPPPPPFGEEGRKWGEEAGSTPGERPCNVVGGKTQGREEKEEEEEGENKEASFFAPPLLPPSSF